MIFFTQDTDCLLVSTSSAIQTEIELSYDLKCKFFYKKYYDTNGSELKDILIDIYYGYLKVRNFKKQTIDYNIINIQELQNKIFKAIETYIFENNILHNIYDAAIITKYDTVLRKAYYIKDRELDREMWLNNPVRIRELREQKLKLL